MELKEKYIQFCCDFYNEHAPEDKVWFGRMFEQCQEDYEQQNRCMYRWQFPLMILKDRQTKIDQLKSELALCREENKGLVGKVSEQQKRIEETCKSIDSFFDDQVGKPTQREYCNFISEIKQDLRGANDINLTR